VEQRRIGLSVCIHGRSMGVEQVQAWLLSKESLRSMMEGYGWRVNWERGVNSI